MEANEKNAFKAKQICQLGMVVKDLDRVVKDWSTRFGLGPWSFADIPGMRVGAVFVGPVYFEIAQPVEGYPQEGAAKLLCDYLDTWGDGVHHVAFGVDDVEKDVANLASQGVKVLAQGGGSFAYLESSGPGSMIFELMPLRSYNLIKEKGLDGFMEEAMKQRKSDSP